MKVPQIDLQAQYQTIRQEIQEAVNGVLTGQKFILGEEGAALETEIAGLCGVEFAIGCASGTDALLLSLLAVGVQPGDEVITTAYSFFATAGMISWLDARPVFVDIDRSTFNMNAAQVSRKITSRTKAIVAVHLFGQCCEIEPLLETGLPVIEDAAQAIGSSRHGKAAGSIGSTGCFSFFPTKNLGAYGDGGMITTCDPAFARKLRMFRSHGQEERRYLHHFVGTNSRLDELQAAILRVKLRHLKEWNEQRVRNAEFYMRSLRSLPVELPEIENGNTSNFHQFVIRCGERDQLRNYLQENGIGTGVYYPVILPLQPCFSDLNHQPGDFPEAERSAATSLALPVYAELTNDQLQYVTDHIGKFYQ
jgi:dTDP-4-amino-4,6-dideoxygalactose transaminase